ncbi:hypothetical protein Tco_0231338 [Tanacetum coccineum]
MSEQNGEQQINKNEELSKPYDCRVTIRSKLKMILKIKEMISSSKKRLDIFKNIVFGKWLDLDDKDYDNHLLNYVLHHQRPDLSKSIDSNILFEIVGRTLLLGRAEFCLVTSFTCGKVKAGLGEAAKGTAAQPSDKGDKDSVTIKDLGELVQDKAGKGKAAQPSDKGDKVSVTIGDLDTANSGQKKETKAMVFYQMDTEEVSDRFVAPCFVNGLEAYDGEINLGVEMNMISNEYAVKLFLEHEIKKRNKVVKKELIVALRGEIYFVKFIINPEEDDVEPWVIFAKSFLRMTKAITDFGVGTVTIYPDIDPFLEETKEEEKSNDD